MIRCPLSAMLRALVLCACAALPFLSMPAKAQAPDPAVELITTYYTNILGRAPDADGLAYWQQQAQLLETLGANPNETWRALGIAFFDSTEYRLRARSDANFVDDLYRTFLARGPDPDGLFFWTAQVSRGLPRDAAVLSFLFSSEFEAYMTSLFGVRTSRPEVDMVVDFYRGFFNRLPDADGFRFWRGRFRAAQCRGPAEVVAEADAMSLSFMSSAEYAARARMPAGIVSDFYNAFLRRGADLEGAQHWVGLFQNGQITRESMRRAFRDSPEFQGRVSAVVTAGCADLALDSDLVAAVADQSVSPFIATLELGGLHLDAIASVRFTVAPKAGALARPAQATYPNAWLAGEGYGPAGAGYRFPVFGLYAGHANTVDVQVTFTDGSQRSVAVPVATQPFDDPLDIYDAVTILKAREPANALGFDYFVLKSNVGSPVVMDSDGQVRWWAPSPFGSQSSAFDGTAFFVGARTEPRHGRLGLDGRFREGTTIPGIDYFHHNVDRGKEGLLVEIDRQFNGAPDLENVILEIDRAGNVLRTWSLGEIISAEMRAAGDDPALFVRPGVDWFHMNAATYDPRDDSLILSSRESFVIKIDYASGQIKWILGDPTKYWYTFPSLRAKSLTLAPGGLYPIGQHALSITADGLLLLFNNGAPSLNQPAGAPVGESLAYSPVSGYEIDAVARTAREAFRFDNGQSILSRFCSSAYEAGDSLLVTYSLAEAGSRTRIVALDEAGQLAFDFALANVRGCDTSWNSAPVPFHELVMP